MTIVFISHSASDSEFVQRRLKPLLENQGIATWVSENEIPMAAEWERRIHQALKEADWILIVLSPEAVASEWVKSEVHWALEKRPGRVIPLLLRECDPADLHLRLLRIQYVDCRGDLDAAGAALIEVIRQESGMAPAPLSIPGAEGERTIVLNPATARLVLAVLEGDRQGERFDLALEGDCLVGRSVDCPLRLDDHSVSRHHARLSVYDRGGAKQVLLLDLVSANGTYVNGERLVGPRAVTVGDIIELGQTRLRVEEID